MTTLVAALVVLGVVIFVHELGHFLAAKAVGVGVPRFSIGFGSPTPLRFRYGETEYVLSWIPLGGYVKMATAEEEGGVSSIEGGGAAEFPPHRLFEHKPLWARILVLSAGVIMNVLLAWGVYAGIALGGGQLVDPITRLAEIDTTVAPAEARDLATVPFGTTITRVNGDTVTSWNDVIAAVADLGSERVRFDFAGGIDPVIVHIPGTAVEARLRLRNALHNLREARVARVEPASPAAAAGIEPGDLVVRINADTVRYWDELVALVRPRPEALVEVTLVRGDEVRTVPVQTDATEDRDPTTGGRVRVGRLGVHVAEPVRRVEFTAAGALKEGLRQTGAQTRLVLVTVRGLVFGRISPKELGGPIAIGQLSGEAARAGPVPFLAFMAFISINLAIFNLLPIPVLDGGHLVFLVLEGLRGKPVPAGVRIRFTQVGLALLFALVLLVMYNDVLRVLGLH
ncbi:MAG: RIP metalloprotease RseP [Gemmatimonadota bacterium]|nr:RIP metalloprotease RseP [Gemmatimonadota bacterium]